MLQGTSLPFDLHSDQRPARVFVLINTQSRVKRIKMNPQYKEITYHQLMKKIEILNELNVDESLFSNLGRIAGKVKNTALGGDLYRLAGEVKNTVKGATKNLGTSLKSPFFGNSSLIKKQEDLLNKKMSDADESDKVINDARPESIKLKQEELAFRQSPTQQNDQKLKLAQKAHDLAQEDKTGLADRNKITADNPIDKPIKGFIGKPLAALVHGVKQEIDTRTYLPLIPNKSGETTKCEQLKNVLMQARKQGNPQAILNAKLRYQKACGSD